MSTEMSSSGVRADWHDVTSRAQYNGETIYVTRNGRRACAVVSAGAAELLEEIEDMLDTLEVGNVLESIRNGKTTPKPFKRSTGKNREDK